MHVKTDSIARCIYQIDFIEILSWIFPFWASKLVLPQPRGNYQALHWISSILFSRQFFLLCDSWMYLEIYCVNHEESLSQRIKFNVFEKTGIN